MKVILRGEVKEVRPGYFRNFLLPQKLAALATPQKIKELASKKKVQEAERAKRKAQALAELKKIEGGTLILEAAADAQGHLYKGVSAKDLAQNFKNIKAEWILLERPIKAVGEYELKVKLPFDNADHLYALRLAVKARSSSL